jgi:cell division protein ZapA (FtsZ GTPase activity inhibitor)
VTSSIKVTILGKDFSLRSEEGEDYINEVAEHVKQRIEIIQRGKTMDVISTVILTCLNIADDYFQVKKARESLIDSIEDRSISLSNKIDAQLQ